MSLLIYRVRLVRTARVHTSVQATLEVSRPVKMTVEVDCSPAEARAFLGLPDVTPLNDHMIAEMRKRMEKNIALLAPEDLMKNWISFGGQAQEQFRNLMTAAAGAALASTKPK